jgi:CRISPR system Cascade subunit CasB
MIPIPFALKGAEEWWQKLQPRPPEQPGDRATLARLRRCATVAEAMQEPSTMALFRRIGATAPADLPAVAITAKVLAHVREDDREKKVARQIGPDNPDAPETALLKPLRFRRLMEADGADERMTAFRRLVALAGGKLHVPDLAEALLRWDDTRRQRWTFDYWNAGPLPANPAKDNVQ